MLVNEISAFNVGDKINMKLDDKFFSLENSADGEFYIISVNILSDKRFAIGQTKIQGHQISI